MLSLLEPAVLVLWLLLAPPAPAASTAPAADADPCASFTWDVRHERALFGGPAQSLTAGTTLAVAPTLSLDRLYELHLSAQPQVSFAAAPGKTRSSTRSFAGLATLTLQRAGVYRVALDQPSWVDVIANGETLRSSDFQGRPGCRAPHKIVEFSLPAGVPLTLQFSGGDASTLKVAVTASAAGDR